MKNLLIAILSITLFACSSPLDPSKTKSVALDLNEHGINTQFHVPQQYTVTAEEGEDDDLLGMLEAKTVYIKAENFNLEITSNEGSMDEIQEIFDELKNQDKFSEVIESFDNGFSFKTNEINGEPQFLFIISDLIDDQIVTIQPQPKSDGNYTKEEIDYIMDILGR